MLRRSAFLFLTLSLPALTASGQTTSKTPTAAKSTGTQKTGATAKNRPSTTASKNPRAIIHTTAGNMSCELFADKAPKAVANFIGLAKGTKDWTNPATQAVEHNKPLYDGVIFHRVIPNFMIQGGDPTGTGTGTTGFTLEDELFPDLLFDKPGRLAYANSGRNSSSSQFFITEKEQPSLNPCFKDEPCPGLVAGPHAGYTIFGQCDPATVVLVKKIARMSRDGSDRPYDPVKIKHIDILNSGAGKAPAHKASGSQTPGSKTSGSKTSTPPGKTTPKQ